MRAYVEHSLFYRYAILYAISGTSHALADQEATEVNYLTIDGEVVKDSNVYRATVDNREINWSAMSHTERAEHLISWGKALVDRQRETVPVLVWDGC